MFVRVSPNRLCMINSHNSTESFSDEDKPVDHSENSSECNQKRTEKERSEAKMSKSSFSEFIAEN